MDAKAGSGEVSIIESSPQFYIEGIVLKRGDYSPRLVSDLRREFDLSLLVLTFNVFIFTL